MEITITLTVDAQMLQFTHTKLVRKKKETQGESQSTQSKCISANSWKKVK